MNNHLEYQYSVQEEHYKTALKYSFQEKIKHPSWVAVRLFCSIGQLLLCLAYILDGYFSGKAALYLIGASFLLCGLSLVYFRDTDAQARSDFKRLKSKGFISEDFWKQHLLTLSDGSIHLTYGCRSIPLDNWLMKAVLFENIIILQQGNLMIDAIPVAELNGTEHELILQLQQEATLGAKRAAAEAFDKIQGTPFYSFNCSYSPGLYFKAQCHAERAFYLSRYSISLSRILLLLCSLGVILYSLKYFSLASSLIALYVCLFLNMRYVIVFSPLLKIAVRRNLNSLPPFLPGAAVCWRFYDDYVVLQGDSYCLLIHYSEICAVLSIPEGLAIRTEKGASFIAYEGHNDASFALFRAFMCSAHQRKSH